MARQVAAKIRSSVEVVRTTLSLNLRHGSRVLPIFVLSLLPTLWQVITLSLMVPVAQQFAPSVGESQSAYIRTVLNWFNQIAPEQKQLLGVTAVVASKLFESLLYLIYYSLIAAYMRDLLHGYRSKMFRNLLGFPMSYFNHERVGSLMQLIGDEMFRSRRAIIHLVESSRAVFSILIFCFLLVLISPSLSLLLLAMGCLVFLFDYVFLSQINRLSNRALVSRLKITNSLQEALAGIRESKLLSLRERLSGSFNKVSRETADVEQKLQFLVLLQAPAFQLMSFLAVGSMVLAYAANILGIRGLGVPGLLVYMVITHELVTALMVFYNNWTNLNTLVPAVPALNHLAHAKAADLESSGKLKPVPLFTREIRFENVGLQYRDRGEILQNIDLIIRRGERIALVGESGSGKTSLINLLVRLFEPTEGRVLIDGTDVGDIDLDHLRSRIGLIPQDVFLFNSSIGDNISLAVPEAAATDVSSAAKRAHADHFISAMPDGYGTVVGERGVRLSGGQKQRIAIAQALLKDPDIVIFDEATSAVDVESEINIQKEIEQISRDKTMIIVAHRLSTVKRADRIYVLSGGSIVESGTWEDLSAQGGYFFHIIGSQMIAAKAKVDAE